jgi:hypothetical protein
LVEEFFTVAVTVAVAVAFAFMFAFALACMKLVIGIKVCDTEFFG